MKGRAAVLAKQIELAVFGEQTTGRILHPRDVAVIATDVVQTWGSLDADPVGLVEIAARLGVSRPTADKWRTRGLLPEPRWTVGGRPAWEWGDVERWAEETGRLTDAARGSAPSRRGSRPGAPASGRRRAPR